jgi:CBS domain containing-hemolysin-like protein
MSVLVSFGIIALLILVNGLFVCAEFSMIGMRPSRIEQLAQEGNRAARWVRAVLGNRPRLDRYIATAQLGVTLASLGLGMYAEPAVGHLIDEPLQDLFGLQAGAIDTISFLLALTLITYLHIVGGEMVPKSLALQNAERTVLLVSGLMRLAERIFSIPVALLNRIGRLTLKLLKVPPQDSSSRLYTLDELELIVSESYAGGVLTEHEQELVANILDFAEARVEQVMMPRMQMMAAPITASEQEMLDLVGSTPYSRLPVYEGNIDNVVGMVHLKDLVRQQLAGEPFDLSTMVRPIAFVPETLPVERLLASFRKQHQQMAIVMDEHGGTLGLVTLEDVLEEVVGEVRDEFDVGEEEPLTLVKPGYLVAQGTVQLEDVEEYVHVGDHGYDVQTVGGLAWAELGRRPLVGDEVSLGKATLRIEAVDGLTVKRVSIRFPPQDRAESL